MIKLRVSPWYIRGIVPLLGPSSQNEGWEGGDELAQDLVVILLCSRTDVVEVEALCEAVEPHIVTGDVRDREVTLSVLSKFGPVRCRRGLRT